MKKLLIIFCLGLFTSIQFYGQDWYGAGLTGKYVVGLNATYNGKFRVGLHYNMIGNNEPFNRAMIYNIKADVGIDHGFSSIGAELGFGQVYANGNDNIAGFGLGTRLGFRYDYCPLPCDKESKFPKNHNIDAKLSLFPGYYSQQYSVGLRLESDIVKLNFGSNYASDDEQPNDKGISSVELFGRAAGGIHFDYTTAGTGKAAYHATVDLNHNFYWNEEHIAWNTYTDRLKTIESIDYGISYKDKDYQNVNCQMPSRNYEIKISQSLSF